MNRFPIPLGHLSRRVHGARREIEERREAALAAAFDADARGEEHFAAALRGKARGYQEAAEVVRALERGSRIPNRARRRWWPRAAA